MIEDGRQPNNRQGPLFRMPPVWNVPKQPASPHKGRNTQIAFAIAVWCARILSCVVLASSALSGQAVVPSPAVRTEPQVQTDRLGPEGANSGVETGPPSSRQPDSLSPADEQGKAPSFSRDEPNRSLVVVGRTQEGFWADLRGNYPLTSEQLAQRYYNSEFTVREALDAITRIARERQLSERMPAGWERPSTLRGTAATLIQVQKLAVPILNEPTLVSENLVVRALAK